MFDWTLLINAGVTPLAFVILWFRYRDLKERLHRIEAMIDGIHKVLMGKPDGD